MHTAQALREAVAILTTAVTAHVSHMLYSTHRVTFFTPATATCKWTHFPTVLIIHGKPGLMRHINTFRLAGHSGIWKGIRRVHTGPDYTSTCSTTSQSPAISLVYLSYAVTIFCCNKWIFPVWYETSLILSYLIWIRSQHFLHLPFHTCSLLKILILTVWFRGGG